MIVIVVAKLGENTYESRVRNGTGPRSHQLPNIPICFGDTLEDVIQETKSHLKPSLIREHRGACIEVLREDPVLTGR